MTVLVGHLSQYLHFLICNIFINTESFRIVANSVEDKSTGTKY
jgi:hypothetical protein